MHWHKQQEQKQQHQLMLYHITISTINDFLQIDAIRKLNSLNLKNWICTNQSTLHSNSFSSHLCSCIKFNYSLPVLFALFHQLRMCVYCKLIDNFACCFCNQSLILNFWCFNWVPLDRSLDWWLACLLLLLLWLQLHIMRWTNWGNVASSRR